jgi:hypothetical protein
MGVAGQAAGLSLERLMKQHTVIFILALFAWAVFGDRAGYFAAMPGLTISTPDAQSYLQFAPYRLPVYGWLANAVGLNALVWLQGAAFALSAALVAAATRRWWAAVLMVANVGLAAITFHALTESFAVLAISAAVWLYDRKKWSWMAAALIVFLAMRPILPMPTEAFRQMAAINKERFMAHVVAFEPYMSRLNAAWWVYLNDVRGLFVGSNFIALPLKSWSLAYTMAIWTLFIMAVPRADKLPVLFVAGMIVLGGLTYFQGDRILMPCVPVVIYTIARGLDAMDRNAGAGDGK